MTGDVPSPPEPSRSVTGGPDGPGAVATGGVSIRPTVDGYRPGGPRTRIDAGVVAHNEELSIQDALGSLRAQELPPRTEWGTIWVVASGCTDRTVERARAVADPRVEIVVEPVRRGKAEAIDQVLRRATSELVVLLNADALADPRAVGEMIRAAEGQTAPFAVMARPVVSGGAVGRLQGTVRLLWALHHELHLAVVATGECTHLSDELLLLAPAGLPALAPGTINDGSFLGAWLARSGKARVYAPAARVAIQTPRQWRGLIAQRRRIRVGHDQVATTLGVRPNTLTTFALRHPSEALRLVRRAVAGSSAPVRDLALLGTVEFIALTLSLWDRLPPRKDHAVWVRVAPMRSRRTGP